MNYYPFHIGDYAKKTRHLSWDEDMAYRRLMDAYYLREGPLPADKAAIYRLVMATSKAQRAAVDVVLSEFFVLGDGCFSNGRCDEELGRWKAKADKAAASANARWKNANAMRTHCVGNANHNHNQEPDIKDGIGSAREPLADLEVKLREAAGWQSEPAPMLAVTGPVQAIIDAGADIDLDVLPTVRALAASARSRTSWKYFLNAIAQARDDRIGAAKIVSIPTREDRHGPNRKAPSRADTFAKLYAVCDEAERREIEARNGDNRTDVQGAS